MNDTCQENSFTGESQELCACCGRWGWKDSVRTINRAASGPESVNLCEDCLSVDPELEAVSGAIESDIAKDFSRTIILAAELNEGSLYVLDPSTLGARKLEGNEWELNGRKWEFGGERLTFLGSNH
jgi:hypothetical protein